MSDNTHNDSLAFQCPLGLSAPRPVGETLSSLSTLSEYAVEIEVALINDKDYMTLQGRRELVEFVRSKHKQRPGEG